MSKINPFNLITNTRFDVIIKYLYAKSILTKRGTKYYKNIYREHLKCWNGFKEYNNPDKNTFDKFDQTFISLIDDFKTNGFDENISKLAVQNNSFLLNGAHRLAAAIATNVDVHYYDGIDGRDGQLNCDYKMFEELGLDSTYLDLTAIEYAKIKPNSLVICLFPVCNSDLHSVINLITSCANIFYKKDIELNSQGAFNLMRELYLGESWAGNWNNNYDGYRAKANLCFPNDDFKMTSILVDVPNINTAVLLKDKIRNIFKVGKHSVHINDTHDQTVRLAKTLFNDNSLHFLCNSKTVNFKKFKSYMNQYAKLLYNNNVDCDNYCVTASGSIAAFGLRESFDIDYLHTDDILQGGELITSHNDYGVGLYEKTPEEIIYDGNLHFYHRGLKFTSLDQVKKLKITRNEPKDVTDVQLIDSVL